LGDQFPDDQEEFLGPPRREAIDIYGGWTTVASRPQHSLMRSPFVSRSSPSGSTSESCSPGQGPTGSKLLIQRRQRGRWIAVKKLIVTPGAVFTAKLPLRGKQRLRAKVVGNQNLVWQQR
jgi:hypothetical protein